MERPGFEEKQYDNALQLELAAGLPWCYPSAPVLEAVLGYDFVIDPGKKTIWEILGTTVPLGLILEPHHWGGPRKPPADRLPSRPISLIVQAKRAVRLNHWRAGQDHYWRGAYYRFPINQDQQLILAGLEEATSTNALVRYASPAFVSWAEHDMHQAAGELAENLSFVSPATLNGHSVWTYRGPGTVGHANPEGEESPADTFETLMRAANEFAREQSFEEHFFALQEVAQGLVRSLRFEVSATRRPAPQADLPTVDEGVPRDVRDLVQAWLTFSYTVAWAGATWLIIGLD